MMPNAKFNSCQWPGCRHLAVSSVRRGETMPMMYVCTRHLDEFRGLSNAQARRVSDARQVPRRTTALCPRPGRAA